MTTLIRLIACAAIAALIAPSVWAEDEKVEADKLPQKVKDTLKTRWSTAKVTTATKTMENGAVVYDIEMTQDGKKREADIKEDGSIVNFENEIAIKDLPKAVADAVKAKHPDAKIKEAMETLVIKDGKDTVDEYEVLLVTGDNKEVELTVSPDGKKIE
jgi:hypothetical protein